jgi:hypothetical protein
MNRRTPLMLTGLSLLGLAIATLPHASFAQSDPFPGPWQLNLAKSKYSPAGPFEDGIAAYRRGDCPGRAIKNATGRVHMLPLVV